METLSRSDVEEARDALLVVIDHSEQLGFDVSALRRVIEALTWLPSMTEETEPSHTDHNRKASP
jgi:hypothetical protein